MKVILYLNGGEGLAAFRLALKYTHPLLVVLPEEYNNDEIVSLADTNEVPVYQRSMRQPADLKAYTDAVIVSSAFPYKIYEDEYMAVSRAVNFHGAILPKYRGRHGNIWAMINDETRLGITAHEIDDGFDSGKVAGIKTFEIKDDMSRAQIEKAMATAHEDILTEFMSEEGEIRSDHEPTSENIYWRSRTKQDGFVNWHSSARDIYLFVRALSRPGLYAWSRYNRHSFSFVELAISEMTASGLAGRVVVKDGKTLICAGDGRLLEVVSYESETGSELREGMVLH